MTLAQLQKRYQQLKDEGLNLDMTRGKPSPEQLDLSLPMLGLVGPDNYTSAEGVDCRNYGGLDGLKAAKALFSEFLEVKESEIIIGGNSSLALMHDTMVNAMIHGFTEAGPWIQQKPKFICPAPGYDRHFNVCQHLGIELIRVNNGPDGPDMDAVEALVAADASIKGIWIVPKYGNPTGGICSNEVVNRLATMKIAATDFRIFWDNAYTVHHLDGVKPALDNILEACQAAGNPDRVFLFGSTSKITFAGAGVAMMGGSEANMDWMRSHMKMQTIGSDKLNQLRHVRFFSSMDAVHEHMQKHAAILRPKFDMVLSVLEKELGGTGMADWNNPQGGYFISLNTQPNLAKKVVQLAAEAGVKLTGAGAAYPYKNDPQDRNIRIAPSLPPIDSLEKATEILAVCIQLASKEV